MSKRNPVSVLARTSLLAAFLLITYHSSLITARAQSATATLSGTVVDQNGAVVPGANVTILNTATSSQRKATTSDDGDFVVPLLPPGTYTVRVERDSFATLEARNIVLNVGDQKALQIQLKAGDVTATVQITNEAPLINDSPAVGTVVDRQFVENLPLNGRSFQSLITLTPGVVLAKAPGGPDRGQFSVNGQRANANYFTVDGVSANFAAPIGGVFGNANGSIPAVTSSGGTNGLVSVDALEEFKIQTSTYAPEFGRSPGAQVSLVTRSGTNAFHASIFDYIRNEALDASDWFANRNRLAKPPLRQNDFGVVAGGPVILPLFGEGGPAYWSGRNRTFFFFSYEGLRLRLPQVATTSVPSLSLRQAAAPSIRPLINVFPLPNGQDFGNGFAQLTVSYSDPSDLDATSIRIDHTLNEKLTLFGRYNQSASSSSTRLRQSLSSVELREAETTTATFGATMAFTQALSNDLRLNYSRSRTTGGTVLDSFGGAVVPSESLLFGPNANFGNTDSRIFLLFGDRPTSMVGRSSDNSQHQINLLDTFSFVTGSHQLKLGLDFRRLSGHLQSSHFRRVIFTNAADIRNGLVSQFIFTARSRVYPIYQNFSTFAQDTWKVSPRLTLVYGLRWDINPPPGSADGRQPATLTQIDDPAAFALAPAGTSLYKTTYNNFAPRFGLAYYLSRRPGRELVLRGGLGVFYDLGNGQTSVGFVNPPFSITSPTFTAQPYPISPSIDVPPKLGAIIFPVSTITAFDPNLKTPYTYQWNLAVEQSIGSSQTIAASYVAALGRRLSGQIRLRNSNATFGNVSLVTNSFESNYQALQLQFQRRLSRGLQAVISYTWAHAIDDVSFEGTDFSRSRGDADFDVRHNLSAAVTYNFPGPQENFLARKILRDWSLDTIFHAQTATPFNLVAGSSILGGLETTIRPDLLPGIPLYLDDPLAPGGRRLNNTVDPSRPNCKGPFCIPPAGRQGTMARNVLRSHPLFQVDLALRRQFSLGERLKLQLRAEMFNALNHPNFADPNNTLTSGLFGESTSMLNRGLGGAGLSPLYQIGGPRSMQMALKVLF